MQLSLALAYKSDSEDPSGISKCCSAVFLLVFGGAKKMFVIAVWTASCSHQVDEIDFFFLSSPPPPAVGEVVQEFSWDLYFS